MKSVGHQLRRSRTSRQGWLGQDRSVEEAVFLSLKNTTQKWGVVLSKREWKEFRAEMISTKESPVKIHTLLWKLGTIPSFWRLGQVSDSKRCVSRAGFAEGEPRDGNEPIEILKRERSETTSWTFHSNWECDRIPRETLIRAMVNNIVSFTMGLPGIVWYQESLTIINLMIAKAPCPKSWKVP